MNLRVSSGYFWLAVPVIVVTGWFAVERGILDTGSTDFEPATSVPLTQAEPMRAAFSVDDFSVPSTEIERGQRAFVLRAQEVCAANADDGIVIGDVISLKFYERGSVPVNGADADLQTIAFERLDLSGDVEVGSDGSASIPVLGRISLAGRGLACAEALIERDMSHEISFEGRVNTGFVSRSAVLVDGEVARPGTYAYAPSLTVGRILVQAGIGTFGGQADPSQLVALRGQSDELETNAAVLILERARNQALLSGSRALEIAPDDKLRISNQLGPDALSAEEDVLIALSDEKEASAASVTQRITNFHSQIDMLGVAIEGLEKEVSVLRERRDYLDGQRRPRSPTSSSTYDATLGLLAVERILLDREQALAQTQENLDQAMREDVLANALHERETRLAIRNSAIDLRRANRQIAAISRQIGQSGSTANDTYQYVIERPVPGGLDRIDASKDTPVLPGDLIHVQPTTTAADVVDTSQTVPAPDAGKTDR